MLGQLTERLTFAAHWDQGGGGGGEVKGVVVGGGGASFLATRGGCVACSPSLHFSEPHLSTGTKNIFL